MWKLHDDGTATWPTDRRSWTVNFSGGPAGIGVVESDTESLAFRPVGDDVLPVAGEVFVRGDELHVAYPQAETSFALSIVFRPVQFSGTRLVIETTLSIHTSLLDSNPVLDMIAVGDGFSCFTPSENQSAAIADSGLGCSAVTSVARGKFAASVLMSPRDYPATLDLSDDEEIRLRLFGEFLEKGVIRKAMPWIVIDRSGEIPSEADLRDLAGQLANAKLPLMS